MGQSRSRMPFIETDAPLLIAPDDVIPLKEAAHRASRSLDTVRRWVVDYGIGRQLGPGGRIEVSAPALEMVLHGDWDALRLLRAGENAHPRVVRYRVHLGLIAP